MDRHSRRHFAAMWLLYLGQGMLQGLAFSAAVLLRLDGSTVDAAAAALLTTPLVAFSLKFLWAPVVDAVHLGVATRRPLWVAPLQVAMAAALAAAASGACRWAGGPEGASDGASPPAGTVDPRRAAWGLIVVCFISATQDIAVDAWAVEGVERAAAGLAGAVQNVGLLCGIAAVQAMVAALGSWPVADLVAGGPAAWRLVLAGRAPFELVMLAAAAVQVAVAAALGAYVWTEAYAVSKQRAVEAQRRAAVGDAVTAADDRPASLCESEAPTAVVANVEGSAAEALRSVPAALVATGRALLEMARMPWARALAVLLLVAPALSSAVAPAAQHVMLGSLGLPAGAVPTLSVLLIPVDIATSAFIPKLGVLRRYRPLRLWAVCTAASTALMVAAAGWPLLLQGAAVLDASWAGGAVTAPEVRPRPAILPPVAARVAGTATWATVWAAESFAAQPAGARVCPLDCFGPQQGDRPISESCRVPLGAHVKAFGDLLEAADWRAAEPRLVRCLNETGRGAGAAAGKVAGLPPAWAVALEGVRAVTAARAASAGDAPAAYRAAVHVARLVVASPVYHYGVVGAVSVVQCVLGGLKWVAMTAVFAAEATKHPQHTGTVLTCLQSLMNAGRQWSGTLAMALFALVEPRFAALGAAAGGPAGDGAAVAAMWTYAAVVTLFAAGTAIAVPTVLRGAMRVTLKPEGKLD